MKNRDEKQEIYDLIVDAAENILEFDICEVEVPQNEKMIVKSTSSNFPEEGLDAVGIDNSVAGKTYKEKEAFIIDDIDEHEIANPAANTYTSGLSVPIGDHAVFQAASNEMGQFGGDDLEIIELLIGHAEEALRKLETTKREEFLHSLLRHDVKNKLMIIQGYHELMDDKNISKETKNYLKKAEKETEVALDIIKKIKTLEEMKEEEIRRVDVSDSINKAIEQNRTLASEKDFQIHAELTDIDVKGGLLLEELFSNILENSLKHSEGTKIEISSFETNDKCVVRIEDDGKGIPDEDKEQIFGKGFKKGTRAGTGLGMYLVKEIADNYNADVDVFDSKLGGVGFEIQLKRPKTIR